MSDDAAAMEAYRGTVADRVIMWGGPLSAAAAITDAVLAVPHPEVEQLRASFDERLADVQDEYRKAGESWDRSRERLNAERDALLASVLALDVAAIVAQVDAAEGWENIFPREARQIGEAVRAALRALLDRP